MKPRITEEKRRGLQSLAEAQGLIAVRDAAMITVNRTAAIHAE